VSWYFKKDGVEKGPVSEDVLRSMIAAGELGSGVMAFCDGDGCDWRPLDKLEIFREELNIAAAGSRISNRAFMPNREITAKARRKLRGSWPIAVGAMAIYFGLDFALDYMSCAGDVVSMLIAGALEVGLAIVVLNILHSSYASSLQIFGGFKMFLSAIFYDSIKPRAMRGGGYAHAEQG
jgi:hypothetical protein